MFIDLGEGDCFEVWFVFPAELARTGKVVYYSFFGVGVDCTA